MSFETDAPIRTLCPECEKFVETEGFGIPGYVLDKHRIVYHATCRPDLCTHEREYVADWKSIEGNDSVVYVYKCRDCGHVREDELIGAQLRAEGEQDDTE